MKKNTMKDQEQNGKPRRFSLKRETILALNLNDPVHLELARGGASSGSEWCCTKTSVTG